MYNVFFSQKQLDFIGRGWKYTTKEGKTFIGTEITQKQYPSSKWDDIHFVGEIDLETTKMERVGEWNSITRTLPGCMNYRMNRLIQPTIDQSLIWQSHDDLLKSTMHQQSQQVRSLEDAKSIYSAIHQTEAWLEEVKTFVDKYDSTTSIEMEPITEDQEFMNIEI